jgi:hypothetical protein
MRFRPPQTDDQELNFFLLEISRAFQNKTGLLPAEADGLYDALGAGAAAVAAHVALADPHGDRAYTDRTLRDKPPAMFFEDPVEPDLMIIPGPAGATGATGPAGSGGSGGTGVVLFEETYGEDTFTVPGERGAAGTNGSNGSNGRDGVTIPPMEDFDFEYPIPMGNYLPNVGLSYLHGTLAVNVTDPSLTAAIDADGQLRVNWSNSEAIAQATDDAGGTIHAFYRLGFASSRTGYVGHGAASNLMQIVSLDDNISLSPNNTLALTVDTPTMTYESSVSGSGVTFITRNSSNTASSTAVLSARVAGTSAGDPYIQYLITGGGSWSHGSDNSDSDAWVLCPSSTLNGTNVLKAVSTGLVTALDGFQSIGLTNPIGYNTGAGAAVTQITNKATAVTIDAPCGAITMNGAALAANTRVGFTVNNATVTNRDTVVVTLSGTGFAGSYMIWAESVATGSFIIRIWNYTAGSLSNALIINFAVIKAVNS